MIAHWIDFSRFITDEDMWSRWEWESTLTEDETYFIAAYNAAKAKKTMVSFDFSKTNLRVFSKGDNINWEHDGESLLHFFNVFHQGKRV